MIIKSLKMTGPHSKSEVPSRVFISKKKLKKKILFFVNLTSFVKP